MIRNFFVAAVLCLVLMPVTAGAVDWLHFMEAGNGDVVYIDIESIKYTSEHTAEVTTKTESKVGDVNRISTVELDCKINQLKVIKGADSAKDKKWHAVDPDGMDELLLEFVCSLKKAG